MDDGSFGDGANLNCSLHHNRRAVPTTVVASQSSSLAAAPRSRIRRSSAKREGRLTPEFPAGKPSNDACSLACNGRGASVVLPVLSVI